MKKITLLVLFILSSTAFSHEYEINDVVQLTLEQNDYLIDNVTLEDIRENLISFGYDSNWFHQVRSNLMRDAHFRFMTRRSSDGGTVGGN